LADAQTELKEVITETLKKTGTDADTIYNKIIKDITTDKEAIKQAAKILKMAHEMINKSKSEAANLLTDFKALLTNDKAKKAVNELKYEGDKAALKNKGYVDAALENGETQNKEVAKVVDKYKLDSVSSLTEAESAIKKVEDDEDFKALSEGDKKIYKDKVFPRTKLRGKFLGGSQAEKDLAPILATFIKNAAIDSSFSDDESKSDLKDLKEKLEKLEKYKSGVDYKKLTGEYKDTFDKLTQELKEKVNKMEKKQNKSENNDTDPKKPFLKTKLGIFVVIVVVLAVLGAIAYFLKSRSSSDEEAEVE